MNTVSLEVSRPTPKAPRLPPSQSSPLWDKRCKYSKYYCAKICILHICIKSNGKKTDFTWHCSFLPLAAIVPAVRWTSLPCDRTPREGRRICRPKYSNVLPLIQGNARSPEVEVLGVLQVIVVGVDQVRLVLVSVVDVEDLGSDQCAKPLCQPHDWKEQM